MTKPFLSVFFMLPVAAILAFCTSCGPGKNQNQATTELEIAEEKIHQEQYVEAEKDLQKYLTAHPKDPRATVVLASLYSHRAGLRVQDYFQLEKTISAKPSEAENLLQQTYLKVWMNSKNQTLKALGETLMQLNLQLLRAQSWQEKMDQLPDFTPTQAEDLLRAIKILSELQFKVGQGQQVSNGPPVTEGMILYRGVIKIYYFKFLWSQGEFKSLLGPGLCQSSLTQVSTLFNRVSDYLVDVLADFAVGLPKSSEQSLSQIEDIKRSNGQVQANLGSFQPQSQTLNQVLGLLLGEESFSCEF